MKVSTLFQLLQTGNPDDDDVRVVVSGDSYGMTPSVGIKDKWGVINGFDWDNGIVLIETDVELVKKEK